MSAEIIESLHAECESYVAHIGALNDEIEQLREALVEIDRNGSGVSPECEALADLARRALKTDQIQLRRDPRSNGDSGVYR